jgi:DNA-binding transcriptional ArsR family regulator
MTPPKHLDVTFAALADPTRRAILARLASGEVNAVKLFFYKGHGHPWARG